MKNFITTLASSVLLATASYGGELTTQDNQNYVVTVTENSDWERCSSLVCEVAQK